MADNDHGPGTRRTRGAHRMPARHSVLTRTVAAGGAAFCIGAVAETPAAEALSIILPAGGAGNTTQLNILEGNIINPQVAIPGSNVSSNSTAGGIAAGNGNNSTVVAGSTFWSQTINLAGTTGTGNTTQVDIFSYNVINPQLSMGGSNTSNNSSVSNVATGNGNNSSTTVTSGAGTTMVGAAVGNGNTTQIAIGSGNIINPQWSFGGSNTSNNTTVGNVSAGNGNNSSTTVDSTGGSGTTAVGGVTGNGNTVQTSFLSFNIINPQRSFGGSNTSNNSTTSNVSSGNGNGSSTDVSGGGGSTTVVGTTGNGNTTQQSNRSGQIFNRQTTSALPSLSFRPPTSTSGPASTQSSGAGVTSVSVSTASSPSPKARTTSFGGGALGGVRSIASKLSGQSGAGPRHAKADG
ncbi:hypothetical protein [Mycobacterium aquaticum]|uniref:Uncharacterized protein n=1 Tax=Mycobacterium aquaticum TaxID=1927124 RepID=A0A1X0AVK1_9MYCO|nr:hypothetical protein [Mycobacterium aquaticum]ORA33696.1 hypothetical protein BST13_19100 [Mycobacterium aquaticum]